MKNLNYSYNSSNKLQSFDVDVESIQSSLSNSENGRDFQVATDNCLVGKRPVGRPRKLKIVEKKEFETMSGNLKRRVGRPRKEENEKASENLSCENYHTINPVGRPKNRPVNDIMCEVPLTRSRFHGDVNDRERLRKHYCENHNETDEYMVEIPMYDSSLFSNNAVENCILEYKMRKSVEQHRNYFQMKMNSKEHVLYVIA